MLLRASRNQRILCRITARSRNYNMETSGRSQWNLLGSSRQGVTRRNYVCRAYLQHFVEIPRIERHKNGDSQDGAFRLSRPTRAFSSTADKDEGVEETAYYDDEVFVEDEDDDDEDDVDEDDDDEDDDDEDDDDEDDNEDDEDYDKDPVEAYRFNENFNANSMKNDLHDVPEGGYVEISEAELERYLPEGFEGETLKEFDVSGAKFWMIRKSTKLLMRLIEDFDTKSASRNLPENERDPYVVPRGYTEIIELEGLTDKFEWKDSVLRVYKLGNEITLQDEKDSKVDEEEDENLAQVKGEGTFVEGVVAQIDITEQNKIIIAGKRGSGKSISLAQAVIHARKRGWIVVYIPSAWDHAHSGHQIEPMTKLRGDPTLFDNELMSTQALRGLWMAHSDKLGKIQISPELSPQLKKYEESFEDLKDQTERARNVPGRANASFLTLRALVEEDDAMEEEDKKDIPMLKGFDMRTFQAKTLEDLVLLGLAVRSNAGSIMTDVINELKNYDNPSEPVLFAVDQYNSWMEDSVYQFKFQKVHAKDICIPRAMRFQTNKKLDSSEYRLKNGLCFGALSFKHVAGAQHTFSKSRASVPILVTVPNYSRLEFFSAIQYYASRGLVDPSYNMQELIAYRTFTNSNPRLARTDIISFFAPICSSKMSEHLLTPGKDFDMEKAAVLSKVFDSNSVKMDSEEDRMIRKKSEGDDDDLDEY